MCMIVVSFLRISLHVTVMVHCTNRQVYRLCHRLLLYMSSVLSLFRIDCIVNSLSIVSKQSFLFSNCIFHCLFTSLSQFVRHVKQSSSSNINRSYVIAILPVFKTFPTVILAQCFVYQPDKVSLIIQVPDIVSGTECLEGLTAKYCVQCDRQPYPYVVQILRHYLVLPWPWLDQSLAYGPRYASMLR